MLRLACFLLLLLVSYQLVVQAADAPGISPPEEEPTSCVDGCSKRTLFDIIRGCLSTTIICAWAAIHPNIPPQEGFVEGTLQRLELMFWAIVAPEILPAWALNQRLAADTVKDVYNEGKGYKEEERGIWKTLKGFFSSSKGAKNQAWTLEHGHFLIMGGFHLVEPVEASQQAESDVVNAGPTNTPSVEEIKTDAEKGCALSTEPEEGRVTILTLEMLRELVKDPEFRIRTTKQEITQRSKGDALSKIILILQSSWFIMQCISRFVQGLALTQLELTTLALASLNAITFVLWWNKPLGAQALVRVPMKRKLTDAERNLGGRGQSARQQMLTMVAPMIQPFVGEVRKQSEKSSIYMWVILPWVILLILPVFLFLLVFIFALALFATSYDTMGGSFSFPVDATHVPTFYVPKHRYSEYLHIALLLTLGTIFGGIHCAGWNFTFPTNPEHQLWRVASIAVTIPIAAVPFSLIVIVIFALASTALILIYLAVSLAVSVILILITIVVVFVVTLIFGFIFRLFCASGPIDTPSESIDRASVADSSANPDKTVSTLPLAKISYIMCYTLAYATARLVLLGMAVALLRQQPPSAFIAVNWTKFYPHIL